MTDNLTKGYKNWIFDLDDTLYPEIDYIKPAYFRLSKEIEQRNGIPVESSYNFLLDEFIRGNRHKLFDRFITSFGLNSSSMEYMLSILRSVTIENGLQMYPHMIDFIEKLKEKEVTCFVVTNGNVEQQRNKINHLGIARHFAEIVYANNLTPKPDPASWYFLKRKFNLNESESVYVGDAQSDELFAVNSGIRFIHLNELQVTF